MPGSAVVTLMSPPINSGGSIAIKSGLRTANDDASSTVAAQTQVMKSSGSIANTDLI